MRGDSSVGARDSGKALFDHTDETRNTERALELHERGFVSGCC